MPTYIGPTGSRGLTGPKGDKGEKGDSIVGPVGPVGPAGTYTDAAIKAKYENNANTNAFTDDHKTCLTLQIPDRITQTEHRLTNLESGSNGVIPISKITNLQSNLDTLSTCVTWLKDNTINSINNIPISTVDGLNTIHSAYDTCFTNMWTCVNKKIELSDRYQHPNLQHIPLGGASGQVLEWDSSGTAKWADKETRSFVDNVQADWNITDVSDKARILNKPSFSCVGETGQYDDILNRPILSTVATTGLYCDLLGKPIFDGTYLSLSGKPDLCNVAITGLYCDLTGLPDENILYSKIIDPPVISCLGKTGLWADILQKPDIFSGKYCDLFGKPSLSNVAISGDFRDLICVPPIFKGNLFDGKYDSLSGKPTLGITACTNLYCDLDGLPDGSKIPGLATVATSGLYSDLNDAPTFHSVATSGNYSELNGTPSVYNGDKSISDINIGALIGTDSNRILVWDGSNWTSQPVPTLSTLNLHSVATSGSYLELKNKPTVPRSLDMLDDVVISGSVSNGNILSWDGCNNRWTNVENPSATPVTDFDQLTNVPNIVPFDGATATDGQILVYDATNMKYHAVDQSSIVTESSFEQVQSDLGEGDIDSPAYVKGQKPPVVTVINNPIAIWSIAHEFDYNPIVSVYNAEGELLMANVAYPYSGMVKVYFSTAVTGYVQLK